MFSCCEIFENTYFEEHLRMAFRKWLFETLFLDSLIQNHPDSVILQKYQSTLNQSFKLNSAHMSSLSLTPTLPFEPTFPMFSINSYYTKNKHFQSWDSLFCVNLTDICKIIAEYRQKIISKNRQKWYLLPSGDHNNVHNILRLFEG